jgi:type IV pilus assembly protein PilB
MKSFLGVGKSAANDSARKTTQSITPARPQPQAAPAAPARPQQSSGLAALELLRAAKMSEASLAAAGFANVEAVVQAVAEHFKVPRLELDGVELGPELAELVPRQLAEKHRIVPAFASAEELTVATADPMRIELFDWLQRQLRRTIMPVVAAPAEIDRALRRLYDPIAHGNRDAAEVESVDVSQEALFEATSIVDRVIIDAVAMKASDIHIEATDRETVVRYRIDGVLRLVDAKPIDMHPAITSRIKILSSLDISIRQTPQDGRIKMRRPEGDVDLRVSVLPTYWGEKVVCRILDNTKAALPLEQLGFDADQLALFERMIRVPYGILLVTGPTGSGKSTTLYGALNAVRSPEINIVSVEDPVEYQLPGINQVQVNPKRGMTFAGALRSILRQDPNVILIGEIRDHETGIIAAEAALTGHLVMSSLHTNDAPSSITRLIEMGIEPYLVAPALVGIIAQRLLRKVCGQCAEEYEPTEAELVALGLPSLPPGTTFRRGRGCAACQRSGYSGRTAIRELLNVTDPIRAAIARGSNDTEIRAIAVAEGFRSMRMQALKRLFAGVTTFQEVLRVTR